MCILKAALLLLLSRRPRQPRRCQMWAVVIVCLLSAAYKLSVPLIFREFSRNVLMTWWLAGAVPRLIESVAVLLLNLRPRRLAYVTSTPCGRKLIYLGKVISAVWLASGLVLAFIPSLESLPELPTQIYSSFSTAFTAVVLSLGSLQNPADSLLGPWIDVIMHILFLWGYVFPSGLTYFFFYFLSWPDPSPALADGLSFIVLLVLLLIGNLQIPAAVVQIVLSSVRLVRLLAHKDYNPRPHDSGPNMVPAIEAFYVLATCQGALYVMASLLGLLSSFPRRSVIRRSKIGGELGAKAIDLYCQRAYATRMKIGVFAAGSTISFANFAIESLSSTSRELQVAGVCVLDSILQRRDRSKELVLKVTSSTVAVSTLIGMLAWTEVEDSYIIRQFSARVTIKLADSLRIDGIPGMVKLVSSLLAENAVPNQHPGHQESSAQTATANGGNAAGIPPATATVVQSAQGISNGGCSWVLCGYWQQLKEMWSVPEDPTLTRQDSLPVLGMVILEKLACDLDNCAEIAKATNLISKTIGLISYTADNDNNNVEQKNALVCSSLKFVRRLAITGEKIGVALRQELWNHPFLLDNLVGVLEDTRSDSRLWKPAMDIIAKLALDEIAGKEIGRTKVITGKLMHAFLARCGSANINDDQSLPMAAGEALANLAMWGTENCSAILEEPGYEVIKDLKSMLCEDEYRYVAANLLQDLCVRCRVKLGHLDASEHLSSTLTIVMEHIEAAEGKQLESLIGLASEIADIIPEDFAHKLESQTNNGAGLVQKLVDTLNSANKKPNAEYPRMRRFIVKMVIAIFKSCHHTVEVVEEQVMEELMEALIKIERTTSKVESYRVFYGNIGVVLGGGEPMPVLVASAKALIRPVIQPAAGR